MTLKLYTLDGSDTPTEVDITANGIMGFKLGIYDDRPRTLSFTVTAPQMSLDPATLAHGTRIKFFDDGTDGGSLSAPLFEGDISDLDPGKGSNEVNIVAIDPSGTTAITAFNRLWTDGTTPHAKGRPRVVYNPIPQDDDYAWANGCKMTVGEIIADLLDVNLPPLVAQRRAPSTGTAYEAGDLTVLTIVPQDKIVIQTQSIRAAIEQVLKANYYDKVLRWEPGTRKWRIIDLDELASITVTLNKDKDGLGDPIPHICLNGQFNRTIEGRATAVRIRGPEGKTTLDLTMGADEIDDISDGPLIMTGAFGDVYGKNKWQIADPDNRLILRTLAEISYAPHVRSTFGSPCNPNTGLWSNLYKIEDIEISTSPTVSPVFMVKYPDDNMGSDAWITIEGARIDFREGIISFGDQYIHRWNPCPPTISSILQAKWTNPTDVRFYFCTPDVPLEVRWPETGFAGTAYDLAGLEYTLELYEEQLAVYQADGVNYTTPERLAAYLDIAKQVHASRCDIIMAGALTLDGCDYAWKNIDGRLCIAAEDGSGGTVTTDMETINARVSEVEYDFSSSITTLTFNSAWLEEAGLSVDSLREKLKLQALTPVFQLVSMRNDFENYSRKSSMTNRIIQLTRPHYQFNFQGGFVDQQGNVQGLVHKSVRTQSSAVSWNDLGNVREGY